jgi:16S rRNA (uracil1498-N3)-methyltransferase
MHIFIKISYYTDMRLNRFIIDFDFKSENLEIKDKDIINQARNVLKLEIGEMIILSDGKGSEAKVEITDLNKNLLTVKILEKKELKNTLPKVALYLAILKKENFELSVQKAVECGVSRIIPIITERTVKTGLNTERIEKITKEASEQSGQNFMPKILPIKKYQDALSEVTSEEKILFHPLFAPIIESGTPSSLLKLFSLRRTEPDDFRTV